MNNGEDLPWDDQPALAVRAIARAEADRLEAAAAAAWDAAAARGPAVVTVAGATGNSNTNGTFDRVPAERAPGGPPVYKRRTKTPGGKQPWLFLACNNMWIVGNTGNKDARKAAGWAYHPVAVADGKLPHEAPAGGWQVSTSKGFAKQQSVRVVGWGQ